MQETNFATRRKTCFFNQPLVATISLVLKKGAPIVRKTTYSARWPPLTILGYEVPETRNYQMGVGNKAAKTESAWSTPERRKRCRTTSPRLSAPPADQVQQMQSSLCKGSHKLELQFCSLSGISSREEKEGFLSLVRGRIMVTGDKWWEEEWPELHIQLSCEYKSPH